jgi:tetratricopeptide (TPR) repeat protein
MFGLYVTAIGTPAAGTQVPPANPDALFAQREDPGRAEAAEAIWKARLPQTFEVAWKNARADYWIGGHAADETSRRAALERGVDAGTRAIELDSKRPEGYFWRAANMGALAESFGVMNGLKFRGRIRSDLETVLRMDRAWQQGSADRALGRWYEKVPALFGGSDKEAEAHYRASLKYNAESTASLYFLAELLIRKKRLPEARQLLQQVLNAPIDPDWAPEDREFQSKARVLIVTAMR